MKITFIGTGSGKTSLNRFHSSLFLQSKENSLLIDAGDGVSKALLKQGISFNEIDGILFTHYHSDHFGGIGSLITQMKLIDRKRKLTIYTHNKLSEGLISFLRTCYLFPEILGFELDIKSFQNNEEITISDGFRFCIKKNSHIGNKYHLKERDIFHSFSVLLNFGGKLIFYTSDVGSKADLNLYPENNPEILICETTHIDIFEIYNFSKNNRISTTYLTHVDTSDESKLNHFIDTLPDNDKNKFLLAYDGLAIT